MPAGTFPLIPRRRVIGLAFGDIRSVRRGSGSDVAGSRQYVPGDNLAWIDWAASARLSAVRDNDEFIVHEFFADEAPHVVMVADRRPSMGIRPSPLRRLDKPEALLEMMGLVVRAEEALRRAYRPEGINLGMNLGRSAGAKAWGRRWCPHSWSGRGNAARTNWSCGPTRRTTVRWRSTGRRASGRSR